MENRFGERILLFFCAHSQYIFSVGFAVSFFFISNWNKLNSTFLLICLNLLYREYPFFLPLLFDSIFPLSLPFSPWSWILFSWRKRKWRRLWEKFERKPAFNSHLCDVFLKLLKRIMPSFRSVHAICSNDIINHAMWTAREREKTPLKWPLPCFYIGFIGGRIDNFK